MQVHRYQKWIRVGPHLFNKNFIIRSMEKDGSPITADIPEGGIRVVCLPGDEIILGGIEAEIYRKAMLEEAPIQPSESDPHRTASTGRTLSFPRPQPGGGVEGDVVDPEPSG